MRGYLILNGGDAFSPRCKEIDHTWLQLIRGHTRPRLVVVPAATVEKTQRVADKTMRYFNYLGTFAEYKMITDPLSANTRSEYEVLDKVEAIVLTDGSPVDFVARLRGTHTEAALHRTLQRTAALMATGASAMGIGAVYWLGGMWEPGLGIAPHLAILPHHQLARMRLTPERLLADLPEGVTLIGIDDTTALFCYPDDSYEVKGEGTVVVYRSVEEQDEYSSGNRFKLETPATE
jgi:cyanophycinase-like exopeptidase